MRDDIHDALRRTVEQVMSDERLLGALPEEAAQSLLDRTIARLDAAADQAADVDSFIAAADAIRAGARAAADAEAADIQAVGAGPTTVQPSEDGRPVAAVDPGERDAGASSAATGVEAPPDQRAAGTEGAEPPDTRPAWSEEVQAALDEAVGRLRSIFGRRDGEG